eukprot:CAMPEP_0113674438 /NCGR_PEP_ID=MMETSP0038_2-20120614/7415_1 /TAXON_ID=2898 /ORGANISM="Cryptomonas paramecium" /LENGTH=150 /DNA_ID=CAMNT_0000591011 /DNA_START=201 /DNA_END=650 /DNA_ORIENTATION=- /assembly_acc=CAM_ASM_000170
MDEGQDLEMVQKRTQQLSQWLLPFRESSSTESGIFTVIDCLKSVMLAKTHGWIDFSCPNVDIDKCIDMQEYLHYDREANGRIHVVVPSKLIVFDAPFPAALSAEQTASMLDEDYYADVLLDFGACLVVACHVSAPSPAHTDSLARMRRAG